MLTTDEKKHVLNYKNYQLHGDMYFLYHRDLEENQIGYTYTNSLKMLVLFCNYVHKCICVIVREMSNTK